MPSKKIYAPFIENNIVLCSRCFAKPGAIEKYGYDEGGHWFIASCSHCGTKMKWYRSSEGILSGWGERDDNSEENSFSFHLKDGEVIMKSE